jgi:U3 small nucleolar RNA-associated protein 10
MYLYLLAVTENPQTHCSALLLMGQIAKVYPKSVLLNVVPLFTFMGTNTLRTDDDYSFEVTKKTIETIIPAIMKSFEESQSDAVESMSFYYYCITH